MSELLAIAVTLLRTLASVPASSSFLTPHIDGILSAVASVFERGEAALPELQALTDHITGLVRAGTDPTPDDFAKLKAMSDANYRVIEGQGVSP